jgi:hypothetical protein
LEDGTYTGFSITVTQGGCRERPIIVRAKNRGQAHLTGELYFTLRNIRHVTFEGLTNGVLGEEHTDPHAQDFELTIASHLDETAAAKPVIRCQLTGKLLHLTFSSSGKDDMNILITGMEGKIWKTQQVTPSTGLNNVFLSLNDLPPYVSEASENSSEASKHLSEVSESHTEVSKHLSEASESHTEASKLFSEATESHTGASEWIARRLSIRLFAACIKLFIT